MRKKRSTASRSKALSRRSLFNPPPILEGEDATGYDKLLNHMSSSVEPTDIIEQIWMHDLADSTWMLFRLRRIQRKFLTDKVISKARKMASDEATSAAEAEAETLEGPEKGEMYRLLHSDAGLSWEQLVAQNPGAHKRFSELYDSAYAGLDMDAIHTEVILDEFDTIERIEKAITAQQTRIDTIKRELDRHRAMQNQYYGVRYGGKAELKTIKPNMLEGRYVNKKVA